MRTPVAVALIVVLAAAGVALSYLAFSHQQPSEHHRDTADADPQSRALSGQVSERDNREYKPVLPGSDDGVPDIQIPEQPQAPVLTFEEEFIRRFTELANAEEWKKLEKHIHQSIVDAPSLKDLLPVLLASLEGIQDRIGYFPVGRGVQSGFYLRPDLKEHADEIAKAFFDTSSPLIHSLLAPVLGKAFYGTNATHVTTYIERLLSYYDRERAKSELAGLSWHETLHYETTLLAVHRRLSASVLDSIRFVEGLRADGLRIDSERRFWDDCALGFHYKRYADSDLSDIVSHLIAHTDRSLNATSKREEEIERLKKIWNSIGEKSAYDDALRHAESVSDPTIREAYDQILAHWLAKNASEDE